MDPFNDRERKTIIEFCHLLEKSKQLFNGLRELPQYGHKQWQTYFGRTFDVYTKLWKYQQQHRLILDNKYGLKRWQIGEIASKIGQLYYHFYLRTSEIIYLHEAFSFYSAIRNRKYYTEASQEDRCELMIKKLRYYARYIVVCLLLKNIKLVKELIKELDRQIIEYGNTYNAEDQMEWTVVVDEVRAFVQVEPVVSVIHPENHAISLSHRLSPQTTPPVEITPQMIFCLQEVLIVGSSSEQVKFSELTLDMFRILQTLEREPTGDILPLDDELLRPRFVGAPSLPNSKGKRDIKMKDVFVAYGGERSNPHKYLLYKPSPSQVLVFLASACNELPPDGALLLYISAEGQVEPPYKNSEVVGYEVRGLVTTSKNDIYREASKEAKGGPPKHREIQCLHPGDLCPFTRRPMFLIIDSDNSSAFQNMPRQFGQPLVILMSPVDVPPQIQDRKHQGNLFTLFLHSPLTAFAFCCDVRTLSLIHWESAQVYVDNFMAEASRLLTASRVDPMYLSFMGDDFLRQLVVRYIFCEVTLRAHRAFRARSQLPRTSPPLPDDVMEHPTLISIVIDLATYLKINSFFYDTGAGCSSNTKD